MIRASSKEFELLKTDLNEVKRQINVYFGFIIGTNGLFISIAFIFYNNVDLSRYLYYLISIALINLMLLYNIIRYKFSSHNKIAGYLRLLSFECDYKQEKKSSLHISLDKKSNDLYCWEYIMFRNDSLTFESEFPKEKILKLDFDFENNNYLQCENYNLDYKKTKLDFLNKLIFENKFYCNFLKDFYKLKKVFRNKNKYHKYKLTSWKFISNIFNSFIIIYSGLLTISIFLLFKNGLNNHNDYIFLIILMCSLIFVYYFFFNERQLLRYNKSSDYFLWTFLPFRVEYLNKYDIKPIYSSTFFYRYIKDIFYSKLVEKYEKCKNSKDEKCDKKIINKINIEVLKRKISEGKKFSKKEKKFIKIIKNDCKNCN